LSFIFGCPVTNAISIVPYINFAELLFPASHLIFIIKKGEVSPTLQTCIPVDMAYTFGASISPSMQVFRYPLYGGTPP
jgi:hypothetical protein